jgi:hypothetical protein
MRAACCWPARYYFGAQCGGRWSSVQMSSVVDWKLTGPFSSAIFIFRKFDLQYLATGRPCLIHTVLCVAPGGRIVSASEPRSNLRRRLA